MLRGMESVSHFEPLTLLECSGTEERWGGEDEQSGVIGEPQLTDGQRGDRHCPKWPMQIYSVGPHTSNLRWTLSPFPEMETEAQGGVLWPEHCPRR